MEKYFEIIRKADKLNLNLNYKIDKDDDYSYLKIQNKDISILIETDNFDNNISTVEIEYIKTMIDFLQTRYFDLIHSITRYSMVVELNIEGTIYTQ